MGRVVRIVAVAAVAGLLLMGGHVLLTTWNASPGPIGRMANSTCAACH